MLNKQEVRIAEATREIFGEVIIFVFVFICLLLIDRSFIFGVLRRLRRDLRHRHRDHRHRDRRHRDPRHRHRDCIRHLPCYGCLCCCWLARSFRYHRRQILPRLETRN